MLEYTNLYHQLIHSTNIINEIKRDNMKDTIENAKIKKAKFVPIVIYLVCTICALILAYYYFQNIENMYLKTFLVLLAGVFNVPFILLYSIHLLIGQSKTSVNNSVPSKSVYQLDISQSALPVQPSVPTSVQPSVPTSVQPSVPTSVQPSVQPNVPQNMKPPNNSKIVILQE